MRLLFISNLYPPLEIGGYEQWCQEVTDRLRSRGHAVHVLTSRFGYQGQSLTDQDVVRTMHLQADVDHYRPAAFFLKRRTRERFNERELRRAIEEARPDLVVVWGMWDLSRTVPYWAEQWMPGRVVYYVSSYWPNDVDIHQQYWQLPARRPLAELAKKPLRAMALWQLQREGYPPSLGFEHAVCCSHYVRDTLVEAGKLPSSARVLFGGIDPEPFLKTTSSEANAGQQVLRLLYFGSLLPQKGVHTAIEAVGLLRQRGLADQVQLTILGSGHPDYEAHLRSLVVQLEVEDWVRFAGRVPRDEIPSQLHDFDLFLFTSIWPEPMARTVMEAMAAGLLVLGTEVGGQTEMLKHGENGLTFQPEDARALADHVESVLRDPALRQQLARSGQQMILQQFTLQRMVDDIENWLRSIVP
jgi:glycogen(starch) synthase